MSPQQAGFLADYHFPAGDIHAPQADGRFTPLMRRPSSAFSALDLAASLDCQKLLRQPKPERQSDLYRAGRSAVVVWPCSLAQLLTCSPWLLACSVAALILATTGKMAPFSLAPASA